MSFSCREKRYDTLVCTIVNFNSFVVSTIANRTAFAHINRYIQIFYASVLKNILASDDNGSKTGIFQFLCSHLWSLPSCVQAPQLLWPGRSRAATALLTVPGRPAQRHWLRGVRVPATPGRVSAPKTTTRFPHGTGPGATTDNGPWHLWLRLRSPLSSAHTNLVPASVYVTSLNPPILRPSSNTQPIS